MEDDRAKDDQARSYGDDDFRVCGESMAFLPSKDIVIDEEPDASEDDQGSNREVYGDVVDIVLHRVADEVYACVVVGADRMEDAKSQCHKGRVVLDEDEEHDDCPNRFDQEGEGDGTAYHGNELTGGLDPEGILDQELLPTDTPPKEQEQTSGNEGKPYASKLHQKTKNHFPEDRESGAYWYGGETGYAYGRYGYEERIKSGDWHSLFV